MRVASPVTVVVVSVSVVLPRSAEDADPDRDGMTNLQEWLAGTDPTDAASALRFVSVSPAADGIRFEFQAVSGRWYTVQWNTNLLGANWPDYLSFQGTADGPRSVSFTNNFPEVFFRVKVHP